MKPHKNQQLNEVAVNISTVIGSTVTGQGFEKTGHSLLIPLIANQKDEAKPGSSESNLRDFFAEKKQGGGLGHPIPWGYRSLNNWIFGPILKNRETWFWASRVWEGGAHA